MHNTAFEIPAMDTKNQEKHFAMLLNTEDKDRKPVKPQNLLFQFVSSCP